MSDYPDLVAYLLDKFPGESYTDVRTMTPQQQSHAGAGVAAMELIPFEETLYRDLRDPEIAEAYLKDAWEDSAAEFRHAVADVMQASRVDLGGLKDHPLTAAWSEAIRENRDNPGGWIACSERLPPSDALYLIWANEGCFLVDWDEGRWSFDDGSYMLSQKDVTHWRELPPPPNPIA